MSTYSVFTWDANTGTPKECKENGMMHGTASTLDTTAGWSGFYDLAELVQACQVLSKPYMDQRFALEYAENVLVEVEILMSLDQFYHQDREQFPEPCDLVKFCCDPENTTTWCGTWVTLTMPKDFKQPATADIMPLQDVVPFADCISFAHLSRDLMIKQLDALGLWSRKFLNEIPIRELELRLAWYALTMHRERAGEQA
jgi:hypothetical protein